MQDSARSPSVTAPQHSRGCHVRGPWNDRSLAIVRKNHGQRAYSRQQAFAGGSSPRSVARLSRLVGRYDLVGTNSHHCLAAQ